YSLGAGIAFVTDKVNLGVSYDYYDTRYGIPGLPGVGHVHADEDHDHDHEEDEDHDHDHEDDHAHEGPVSIGMKRHRVDLRGEVELGGFFQRAQTRWGYSNYTHTEFEGDEIGTVFDVEGIEGRVELVQARRN